MSAAPRPRRMEKLKIPYLGDSGVAFLALCLLAPCTSRAAQISGVVRHSETGENLAKVELSVIREGTTEKVSATSDETGSFILPDLSGGDYELRVSAVGFGLLRQSLEFSDGDSVELEILLTPGTAISNELTVLADPEALPGQLSSAEVHSLKSVLMDDPLRALQMVPSLAWADDFNTGFSVQGSGFDRVGVVLDGIPLYGFAHTVEGIEDTGSTSLLSAELLEGVSIQYAGTNSQWTGSSAGHLALRSRTGNNARWRNLVTVSGSAFLAVSEGPVRRGNWIVSARKSYIDWIVRRIDRDSTLNFGFYDFFGKVSQSIGSKHQLSFSGFYGNTGLHDAVEGTALNSVDKGRFASSLAHLEWNWLVSPKLTASNHFFVQNADSANRNTEGQVLWENAETVLGVRSAWDHHPRDWLTLSSGVTVESWKAANSRYFYPGGGSGARWSHFDTDASRFHLFGEARVAVSARSGLVAGWAFDDQAGLVQGLQSPYLGGHLQVLPKHRVSLHWGRSGQLPFFNQLFEVFGNPALLPERADNLNVSWLYQPVENLDLLLSAFDRNRSEVPWRTDGLWRLTDGRITPPTADPYLNVLEDETRGMEIRVRRQAVNGLSGWAGYAWSVSRWSDAPGIWYPGNYDQRHGASLFAHYRWSSDLELSFKWRWSTGLPVPAYAQKVGDRYFLAEARNQERLPVYSRADIRMGKSFNLDDFRLTLFVEVLNLFGRENVRFSGHDVGSVNPGTGRIHGLTQSQIPFLPTAGVTIEF